MKSLLTRCPYCGASFYKNAPEKEVDGYIGIVCPYCNNKYKEILDDNRIKEHDFYWEIYSRLYPKIKSNRQKSSRLMICGFLLALTIPFFIYGFSQLLFPENLSNLTGAEINQIYGIGIAGLIFLIFVISGVISAFRRYSFVISLSGIIFAILSSILWFYIYRALSISLLGNFSQFLMVGPQILSIISLALIIRYRKTFKLGY